MKSLNYQQLLSDFNIPFATTGSKHTMPGWINTHCPFCIGPKDYHLGFKIKTEHTHCWRCGWHPLDASVAALTNQTVFEARQTLTQYRTGRPILFTETKLVQRPSHIDVPGGPLEQPHINYLKKRGFDDESIEWLINTYKIKGTGPIGPYNYRIIAPVYFDGNLVSYQGRDYTNKSPLKYKACPKEKEIRFHKDCLYAMDLAREETIVIVEGFVDAWKLGPGAIATFGCEFTWGQVRLLVERFKRHVILFDPDAETHIYKLSRAISSLCKTTSVAILKGWKDPGELSLEKGRELMQLIKNRY